MENSLQGVQFSYTKRYNVIQIVYILHVNTSCNIIVMYNKVLFYNIAQNQSLEITETIIGGLVDGFWDGGSPRCGYDLKGGPRFG